MRFFPRSDVLATRLTIQLLLSFTALSVLETAGPGLARAAPSTSAQTQALVNAQKKIGALEPWQKKIFEEEVLTDSQRFIKDYQSTQVEVDTDGLRRYLAFYAPRALGKPEIRTLVFLNSQEDCAKCAAAIPSVKRQLQARLGRRGIIPVFVSAEEVGAKEAVRAAQGATAEVKAEQDRNTASFLELKLVALAKTRGADGAWLIDLRQVADPAHPGEESFKAMLQSRLSATGAIKDLKTDKSLEVLRNDSMEVAVSRMIVDSMSELGDQASEIAQAASDELEISISGLTSYSQMRGFHAALQDAVAKKLNAITPVELRKLSGDRVVYAVHTTQPAEDLKSAVNLVNFESHGLVVKEITRSDDNLSLILAEVK